MSLINDALKKAQKQREMNPGVTPPPGMPPPPAPPSAAPSPAPGSGSNQPAAAGKHFTLLIAGAAVLVSLSVAVTVYLVRQPRVETRPAVVTTPATQPVVAANNTAPTTAAPAQTSPAPNSAATGNRNGINVSIGGSTTMLTPGSTASVARPSPTVAPGASAVSAPAAANPGVATVAPRNEGAPAPTPVTFPSVGMPNTVEIGEPMGGRPASAAEAPPVKITLRIQGMVNKFRISGIRVSDTDSKVILNDHLFQVGEVVEPSLGLKLSKIEPHLLTFTDADGNKYLKRF